MSQVCAYVCGSQCHGNLDSAPAIPTSGVPVLSLLTPLSPIPPLSCTDSLSFQRHQRPALHRTILCWWPCTYPGARSLKDCDQCFLEALGVYLLGGEMVCVPSQHSVYIMLESNEPFSGFSGSFIVFFLKNYIHVLGWLSKIEPKATSLSREFDFENQGYQEGKSRSGGRQYRMSYQVK